MNATRHIDIAIPPVSVRSWHSAWYCVKTAKRIVEILSPPDSPIIPVQRTEPREVAFVCLRVEKNKAFCE